MAGESIIEFLLKKQKTGFTGCVKLSFEDGGVVSINEANHLDIPMTKNFSQNAIVENIGMATQKTFNGSIVFLFKKGVVDSYSYTRTYKGKLLECVLNTGKQEGK